jgi:hypothetical protein
MTELDKESFTHVLIGDVVEAEKRLRENDNQMHRRNLVRAAFAAIEGLHWQLKQDVLLLGASNLSPFEYAAVVEESYSVDERGNVSTFPRFLPITTAIRLVVNVVKRYRPAYTVDFNHVGWVNLNAAIEIRNRLVHPKQINDLDVTDKEVQMTLSGFRWLLALVIEVLRETNVAAVLERYKRAGFFSESG